MNSTLTLLLLFLASTLFAQTKTTIYGNLGEENVNISIVNTPYGTSTDAKGHYELPIYDRTEAINLNYSCIGYQDTVVSLTPKQLQRDSINVSFRMHKMSYDLQEVGVSASTDFYRSGSNRNIADIAFLDGKIYLLENKPKTSSMVVLDTDGGELARKDFDQLFEKLHIDAFNDLILVGQDSCLQVYLDEKQSIQPVSTFSRDDYRNKLLKIVCEYNGAYIVRTIVHDRGLYFKNEFLVDKATGKVYGLFVDDGKYHVGLYDPESGTIGMGQKASRKIYPRVFKVHDGYAYSVFYDSGKNQGTISRMKIQ